MGKNLKQLIMEKYQNKELKLLTLEKEEREMSDKDIRRLKEIPQISPFFENIKIHTKS